MTSSNPSDPEKKTESASRMRPLAGDDCPECGGRLTVRQPHKFPVALNVAFGVSFVAFLLAMDRLKTTPAVLWGWNAFQIILGGFLVRARARSAKRILICIRCEHALRSSET